MGKVTTYCQISGCPPEAADFVQFVVQEPGYGPRVQAALQLLTNPDETAGQQALSVIGPAGNNGRKWLEELDGIEQGLAVPQERVQVVSGCSMGNMFDLGFCDGPDGESDGALVSYGPCFFVLTLALPILDAATNGRVSPYRLWKLAVIQGHLKPHNHYCLEGVEYGPIKNYMGQFSWMFGELSEGDVLALEDRDSPEVIAEVLRSKGYWMRMRPDRFPIESSDALESSQMLSTLVPTQSTTCDLIVQLPAELLRSLALLLPLASIISLASASKELYNSLLGDPTARDMLAQAYLRSCMPWYLPYGEVELKWWNERNGDQMVGWDYMRRCVSVSHSMRNRRRIWLSCESIEKRCKAKGV